MYGGIYSEAVGGGSQNPFRLASLTVIIHIFSPRSVLLPHFSWRLRGPFCAGSPQLPGKQPLRRST